MIKIVDSYSFSSGASGCMLKTWVGMEKPRPIPWTPLKKPLSACRVALISSAGIALKTDQPFDQEGERRNPWWGDPSYRILPVDTVTQDIRIYHLHIDPAYGEEDLNCIFPLQQLKELETLGEIGAAAPRHYSMMGYNLQPDFLLTETTPAMIANLQEDEVDVVILVPV